jgi:hypothetical protein
LSGKPLNSGIQEKKAAKSTFKWVAAEEIRMETRFVATLLFASLLVPMLGAAIVQKADITPLLNSALTDAQCRVAFETGAMNAIISGFSVMSSLLGPRISDMQSDVPMLSQYASQGDAMNYSKYVQETFTKHLKQNADAAQAGFERLKNQTEQGQNMSGGGSSGQGGGGGSGGGGGQGGGGSGGANGSGPGQGMSPDEMKAAMESLQSEYKTLRGAYDTCFDVRGHAELVLDYYNTTLNGYELRARDLAGRGISASNLLDLVGNARSQMAPLKNGVNSAANSSQIRMLLYQYCLYDGCMNGTNFHMAAKFEAMRMADLLAAMSPKAVEEGLSSNVTAAQASLNAANTEIGSWGAKDATPDQLKAAWTGILSAAKDSHSIFIALNGSAGAG